MVRKIFPRQLYSIEGRSGEPIPSEGMRSDVSQFLGEGRHLALARLGYDLTPQGLERRSGDLHAGLAAARPVRGV